MRSNRQILRLCTLATLASATAWPVPQAAQGSPRAPRSIALPGAPRAGGLFLDYIAYDRAHGRVWVPAGGTGSVDVIDVATDELTRIGDFAVKDTERDGRKRTMGPSSVAVGDGVVFVGNRADDSICALDAASLAKGPCVRVPSMPDAIAVVPSAREAWVTTQADRSIVVLDVSSRSALTIKAAIKVPGSPEGLAVDDARGVVYTNLEDEDRTVAVDVKARHVTATWRPECGEAGPRGLAVDAKLRFVFVACTTRIQVLDAGHDGRRLGALEAGDGIDAIEYQEKRHELFAAASRAAKMVVAAVDDLGGLKAKETFATVPGARNAVVTENGVAYLTDSTKGAILVVDVGR